MSEMTIFAFESAAVRTIAKNGEPWFVATDISKILGYRDAPNMIRNLDEDEADTHNVSIRSENGVEQQREVAIINESGLYAAILKSRRPEAKTFRKWVTSEVLPSIRKSGAFVQSKAEQPEPMQQVKETRTVYPMHEADKVVQSDRVFRAALRSARASGIREEQAFNFARNVAADVTGMDLAGALMKQALAAMPKSAEEGIDLFMQSWVSGRFDVPYSMGSDSWRLFDEYAAWCARENYRQYGEEGFFDRRWRELWPLRKEEIEARKNSRDLTDLQIIERGES